MCSPMSEWNCGPAAAGVVCSLYSSSRLMILMGVAKNPHRYFSSLGLVFGSVAIAKRESLTG